MVRTDKEHTWSWFKELVRKYNLQVNDVKQIWNEIEEDEGSARRFVENVIEMEKGE